MSEVDTFRSPLGWDTQVNLHLRVPRMSDNFQPVPHGKEQSPEKKICPEHTGTWAQKGGFATDRVASREGDFSAPQVPFTEHKQFR